MEKTQNSYEWRRYVFVCGIQVPYTSNGTRIGPTVCFKTIFVIRFDVFLSISHVRLYHTASICFQQPSRADVRRVYQHIQQVIEFVNDPHRSTNKTPCHDQRRLASNNLTNCNSYRFISTEK